MSVTGFHRHLPSGILYLTQVCASDRRSMSMLMKKKAVSTMSTTTSNHRSSSDEDDEQTATKLAVAVEEEDRNRLGLGLGLELVGPTAEYEQVAKDSLVFFQSLRLFHSSFASLFSVPTVGGKPLDLHRLFVEVTSRGGIEKVIKDRKWKEVIMVFNFPSTITSASFVLRKYYLSLLYHFEQVFYFRKQVSPKSASESPTLQVGCSVSGTIDGKFDNGYLVTVNLDSDVLMGVMYHIPHLGHTYQSSNTSVVPRPRNRKRSRMALQDPSQPKLNRSSYNFFFSEQYARLKPLYYGQEKAISKKISLLWSKLSESEKQVYQEKGSKDKERYKNEMVEYKSVFDS